MCRSNRKESFWQNLFVFLIREKPPCGSEPSTQIKVQWKHFGPDEATREEEGFMWEAYPVLFS